MLICPEFTWLWAIIKFVNGLLAGNRIGHIWSKVRFGQLDKLVCTRMIPSLSKPKWRLRHKEGAINFRDLKIFLPSKLRNLLPLRCWRNSIMSAKCLVWICLIQRVSARFKALLPLSLMSGWILIVSASKSLKELNLLISGKRVEHSWMHI